MTDDDQHGPDPEDPDLARFVAPFDAQHTDPLYQQERDAMAERVLASMPLHPSVVDALADSDEATQAVIAGARRRVADTAPGLLPALDRTVLNASTEERGLDHLAGHLVGQLDHLLSIVVALQLD